MQALGAGQTMTEQFTVSSDDGSATHQVTVTIVGTNDVPVLSSGTGAVTEDQNVGNDGNLVTTGQLTITDTDAGQNHFQAGAHFDGSTGNGNAPLGQLVFNADGSYTYTVANSNPVVQGLNAGQSIVETYTVTSQDGSRTSTITITINGTDDGATITPHSPGSDAGAVVEDATPNTTGGKLDVVDPNPGESQFQVQTGTPGAHGAFSIDANGNWTYSLNNSDADVQGLGKGETMTEKFTVKSLDGSGEHTVTVTIVGTNDDPVISGAATGSAKEDADTSVSGQLTVADKDYHDGHDLDRSIRRPRAQYGTLPLDATGKWTYTVDQQATQALAKDEQKTETFTVKVDDGHGGIDTQTVTITITGTNDVPDHYGGPGRLGSRHGLRRRRRLTGSLTIADPDAGESSFKAQTVKDAYGTFTIDAAGHWSYALDNSNPAVQALSGNDSLGTRTFTVVSADGTATHQVQVTIGGTNDAPTAADNSATVDLGGKHTFTTSEFNFADSNGEHDTLQDVIITRTPDSGTLTLNGVAVSAGQVITASDIAAGKLVYTPGADGKDTSFGFKVQDNGGTAHGGQDTSTEHNFGLSTNNLIQGDNTSTGDNNGHGGTTPPLNGGSGDDIILGDSGGTVTTTTPGQNYNIALIVDHSGSMDADISNNQTRMELVKEALTQFVKQLAGHDGIVNVTLIGFGSSADNPITVQNLNLSDVDQATDTPMRAINNLESQWLHELRGRLRFRGGLVQRPGVGRQGHGEWLRQPEFLPDRRRPDGLQRWRRRFDDQRGDPAALHRRLPGAGRDEYRARHRYRRRRERELPEVLRQYRLRWYRPGRLRQRFDQPELRRGPTTWTTMPTGLASRPAVAASPKATARQCRSRTSTPPREPMPRPRRTRPTLNGIDLWDVRRSYRYEQGFTFELNFAGVADEHRRRLRRAKRDTDVSK